MELTSAPANQCSGRGDCRGLTERQGQVLDAISAYISAHGYPPSMREIGHAAGLRSMSSVSRQINVLVGKGHLRKDPARPRSYVPTAADDSRPSAAVGVFHTDELGPFARNATRVPVLGRIAAGPPITAEQQVEDILVLPHSIVGSGDLFVLTVAGDSMTGLGILDGDQVVVRSQPAVENGEIVAAMLDGEATVKAYRRDATGSWLLPANDAYAPLDASRAIVLGKVTAVLRSMRH
ncbi:transcriptional repressor LexA [Streptomyces fractus]|uniref:transcriptional repressor LexA n=1 Tax=Streptomyces fractus TaxID=641806 RepID=UPI003CEB3466